MKDGSRSGIFFNSISSTKIAKEHQSLWIFFPIIQSVTKRVSGSVHIIFMQNAFDKNLNEYLCGRNTE